MTGSAGRELVQQNLAQVVDFYCESAQAGCHAVREAACSCMAELATKLQLDTVRPYVQRLLTTLLVCFNDDSWPVRDGNFLVFSIDKYTSKEIFNQTLILVQNKHSFKKSQ